MCERKDHDHDHRAEAMRFHKPFISLSEACKLFPNGRVSRSSLERWWRKGVRGAVLKTYLIGSRRYTTKGDIEMFVESQQPDTDERQPECKSSQREKLIHDAEERMRRRFEKK